MQCATLVAGVAVIVEAKVGEGFDTTFENVMSKRDEDRVIVICTCSISSSSI